MEPDRHHRAVINGDQQIFAVDMVRESSIEDGLKKNIGDEQVSWPDIPLTVG